MSIPSVGVLVVAYNAQSTLGWTLDRIPDDVRSRISHVLVSDDRSTDDTHAVADAYARSSDLPITVVRQPTNLGYGGNQQFGYRWMADRGVDVVVLLHGDGQYAPEVMGRLIDPFDDPTVGVVLGSRMLEPGRARAGGMPLYKYVGNRVLTTSQNALTGMSLSEWHSGYRAFRTDVLRRIPFERNSHGFDFDTEVLLQILAVGERVVEVPIPTYYGEEICHVEGLRYARDVMSDVVRYRLGRMGFGIPAPGTGPDTYEWKPSAGSAHQVLLEMLRDRPPGRLLDLGCGEGDLGRELTRLGWTVVGVDLEPGEATREFDRVLVADLEAGIPSELADLGPFDVVVAADVLEHVRHPERVLDEIAGLLGPDADLVVSVPNFGHWYPRLRVLAGRFDYDSRGILDRGHVRFFTRRSLRRMAQDHRWKIDDFVSVGLPFDVADRGSSRPGTADRLRALFGGVDRLLVRCWPNLFAYQFVATLRPVRHATDTEPS